MKSFIEAVILKFSGYIDSLNVFLKSFLVKFCKIMLRHIFEQKEIDMMMKLYNYLQPNIYKLNESIK